MNEIKMECKPLVSVIMSTFNTPKEWLLLSINSILNQTYSYLEFIIVDDGTNTYSVNQLIGNLSDSRIKLIINPCSIGLTKSLNKALKICTGDYVARMDSDDISEINRFEKQIMYMEQNQDCVACGSWFKKFGSSNDLVKSSLPYSKEQLKVALFFGNVNLAHPSVMIRRSILLKYNIKYNENFLKAQDYEMWTQLSEIGPIGIVQSCLLNYRVHNNQISISQGSEQYRCMQKIRMDHVKKTGVEVTDNYTEIHSKLCSMEGSDNPEQLYDWINNIINANNISKHFDSSILKAELDFRWYAICYNEYIIKKNKRYEVYMKQCTLKSKWKYALLLLKRRISMLVK